MEEATTIYLGVGSNLEPHIHVPAALERLRRRVAVTALSTCYWSFPVGRPNQPRYVNAVWSGRTRLPPARVREVLRGLEAALGRRRGPDRYASRTIDLDLLLYGDQVIDQPPLRIPDPDIRERPFVAVPLLELAPDLVLPGSGEALPDLVAQLDRSGLRPDPAFTALLRQGLSA